MQPIIRTSAGSNSKWSWGKKMRCALLVTAILCLYFTPPASANNFAVPEKNPIATLVIPDSWKIEDIEYGYSAKSSDGDVFFSVEYAAGARIEKMLDNNTDWMKENHIKAKGKPVEKQIEIGGLPAKLLHYDASDEDGDCGRGAGDYAHALGLRGTAQGQPGRYRRHQEEHKSDQLINVPSSLRTTWVRPPD
jgi:hypothetical protein